MKDNSGQAPDINSIITDNCPPQSLSSPPMANFQLKTQLYEITAFNPMMMVPGNNLILRISISLNNSALKFYFKGSILEQSILWMSASDHYAAPHGSNQELFLMPLYQLFMVDNCWGVIKQVLITDSKLSAWDALNIGAISVEDNSCSIWSVLRGQLCNWLMPGCQSHMVFVAICRISSHYLQLVYITVCNLTSYLPEGHKDESWSSWSWRK